MYLCVLNINNPKPKAFGQNWIKINSLGREANYP